MYLILGAGITLVLLGAAFLKRRASRDVDENPPIGSFCIENDVLTLLDEHHQKHQFKIMDMFQKKDVRYLMLTPPESHGEEVLVMKFVDGALLGIDNEKEFEEVTRELDQRNPYHQ